MNGVRYHWVAYYSHCKWGQISLIKTPFTSVAHMNQSLHFGSNTTKRLLLTNRWLQVHHHHLFWKRPFLPRSTRVRRFSRYDLSIYLWTLPIQLLNTTHSAPPYHPSHFLSKSSCLYPHISPLSPPHFYRPTPNHPHSYVPHAQTTSIYPRLITSLTPRQTIYQLLGHSKQIALVIFSLSKSSQNLFLSSFFALKIALLASLLARI